MAGIAFFSLEEAAEQLRIAASDLARFLELSAENPPFFASVAGRRVLSSDDLMRVYDALKARNPPAGPAKRHKKMTPITPGVPDGLRDVNTIPMVAEYWGISKRTVRSMVDSGQLSAFRVGTLIRITKVAVLECEHRAQSSSANGNTQRAPIVRPLHHDAFEAGKRAAKDAAKGVQKSK